jgi:integrase/recombinase XerD
MQVIFVRDGDHSATVGRGIAWRCSMSWSPRLERIRTDGQLVRLSLGHPVLDEYLAFVGGRLRPNSWLAVGYDLKVFFTAVHVDPLDVATRDVFGFLAAQRAARRGENVFRLEDGEAGLSARTIHRRLSSVSGLYAYLVACGRVRTNPVPRGTLARGSRGAHPTRSRPLIRVPRTLPRVLAPEEVDALLCAARTWRDRAMLEAMVLGGLRRCEVLGLRLNDVHAATRQLFIAEGKGGHQRIVPVSSRFFATLAEYLAHERPDTGTDRVFVVLKRPRRGGPISAAGVDEILDGACRRAGLRSLTCHQLRHTCLTRLRQAGMALEAVQAQAGHRSIESTRIYLHLSNDWLVEEYLRACATIDADLGEHADLVLGVGGDG